MQVNLQELASESCIIFLDDYLFVDECYSSLTYIVLALLDGKHSLLN